MSLQKPYISILISCYNYEAYVERCLNSCVSQTFKDYEIIIVDDASTDNSAKVIEDFISNNQDVPIQFIKLEKNGGPAVAKGTALSSASGYYVIFVDCDDWMDDNCLEVLAENAQRTDADKIRSQCRTFDETTGKIIRERKIPTTTNKWCEGMMYGTLIKHSLIVANDIKFCADRNVSDDLYFVTLVNSKSEKTEYVRQTMYTISYKPQSDSGFGNFIQEKKLKYSYYTNKKIREVYETLDEEDKIGCEYLFAKQYFFLLLQFSRMLEYKDIIAYHHQLKDTITPFFPKFYNNKNIRLLPNGDPFLFRTVMVVCSLAEKIKLMPVLLKLYWCLAKKFDFVTR